MILRYASVIYYCEGDLLTVPGGLSASDPDPSRLTKDMEGQPEVMKGRNRVPGGNEEVDEPHLEGGTETGM